MNKEKGFTLIELLVVIAIIGLLASVVLASLSEARLNAEYVKAKSDIKALSNLVIMATGQQGGTFLQITGSACTECACRSIGSIRELPQSHACWTTYLNVFNTLNNSTGGLYRISKAPTDPWGSPYLFNENEGEGGYPGGSCYTDMISSAGPNGVYYDTDDVVYNIPETVCDPVVGQHHANINWD